MRKENDKILTYIFSDIFDFNEGEIEIGSPQKFNAIFREEAEVPSVSSLSLSFPAAWL